ncbi:hypothetical protein DFA_06431 [Cavenderia fasciculata]|uniref:Uncharacterized protein n=1 Tax=Cavenderia fasciculata TaxID=261658 RepID=F4PIZ5_CACFS|nr:uncharacterized protein DFA_06431 [Cavenderia fasciculata]EGG24281.1 hypothetical protein DFA_06431 [Cavenderia fasciculata]|eukprot:XP_004362132.1 hypothetical protein DFA_06431 [Cavenderia fasciculata]
MMYMEKEEECRELMCAEWKSDEMIAITGAVVCADHHSQTYMSHHVFSRYSLYRDIKTLDLKYDKSRSLFDNRQDPLDESRRRVPRDVFKERFGLMIESFSLTTKHGYNFNNFTENSNGDKDDDDKDQHFCILKEYASLFEHMPKLKHLTLLTVPYLRTINPSAYASIIESIPIRQLKSLTLDIACNGDTANCKRITESIAKQLISTVGHTAISTLKLNLIDPDNKILYPSLSEYLLKEKAKTLTDLSIHGIDDHFPLLLGALTKRKSSLRRLELRGKDRYGVDGLASAYLHLDCLSIKGRGEFNIKLDSTSKIKHLKIRDISKIQNLARYVTKNKHLLKLTILQSIPNEINKRKRGTIPHHALPYLVSEGIGSSSVEFVTLDFVNLASQERQKQLLDLLTRTFPNLKTLCFYAPEYQQEEDQKLVNKCLQILQEAFTMTIKPKKNRLMKLDYVFEKK